MSDALRSFNEDGLRAWRDWLDEYKSKTVEIDPPWQLLEDPALTRRVASSVLDRCGFTTKRDAAEYLHRALDPLQLDGLLEDQGLWSWLGLYFFDDLCPVNAKGRRRINAAPHYIYEYANAKRSYRHLLATPYRILKEMPDHNRIFLDAPVSKHGDVIEQLMGRLYLIRLPGIRSAIDRLYFDESTGRIKKGMLSTKSPRKGDLRNRLKDRIRQIQLTYDLQALSGDQFIELLGPEFQALLQDHNSG